METKLCKLCERRMILAGYGWLCVNEECPNVGFPQKNRGEEK